MTGTKYNLSSLLCLVFYVEYYVLETAWRLTIYTEHTSDRSVSSDLLNESKETQDVLGLGINCCGEKIKSCVRWIFEIFRSNLA